MNFYIESFKRYRKNYVNYFSVMYNLRKNKSIIKVKLRDGQIHNWSNWKVKMYNAITLKAHSNVNIDVNSNDDLIAGTIKFTYKKRPLVFSVDEWTDIIEVFIEEGYKFLDVENENVIDIGTNIGDSTIYFAVSNAKRVLGLEPYPHSYSIALKNLEQNDIGKEKVILLNAGYGEDGLIKVKMDVTNTHGTNLKSSNEGTEIRTISLKTLLKEYDYESPVLKMDCEGCEYNLLKEDNDTLKKFKRMQIEYHYGYEKLKEKLENCGFDVTFTKPVQIYNKDASNPNMVIGQIYAKLPNDS
ncbi:SAM-dependent methyltransferase [Ferroplasma acidiphilum]|uniref:SAM-dependent methyltransferase n=1 Tax=Ferroplasma acidiphilum TaxID=74969 RepID=A0A1V0N401_9ARCH|nr:FkbM family methyltransferase [Ferroplasma acidiphilum]ARD84815.1 SAM-dependent methyltransferase [Ferroplasma acidiphilum]